MSSWQIWSKRRLHWLRVSLLRLHHSTQSLFKMRPLIQLPISTSLKMPFLVLVWLLQQHQTGNLRPMCRSLSNLRKPIHLQLLRAIRSLRLLPPQRDMLTKLPAAILRRQGRVLAMQ